MSESSPKNRYKKGIFPADYLVLGFTLLMLLTGILNYARLGKPYTWISTDCGIIIVLLILIIRETREERRFYYWLHFLWPVISLAFLYTQCTSWDNLIFPNTFDYLLMKWDIGLFGTALNKVLASSLNSLWLDELMHFFYFSYYLIIFLPAAWMLRRRQPQAFELIFSLTLMMLVHFLFFMIFPSDGPLADRKDLFDRGVVFIPLMNFVYGMSEQTGGGAFPSTHVSAAVLIFIFTLKYAPKLRIPVGIFCVGITIATVYCSYHYAIDAAAGIITGTLFYFLGQFIFSRRCQPANQSLFILPKNT
ncbi:MAG TPA: phosphatase PAP2 family protein [Candidatus Marinimicrobia bacterium]|nr:phosphatase PAP2 family protein [Candidatus Neomarinimicrobiota bacterium]HRS50809.1 phosphatase PAP2 family protein [Candidatus Neomarinimicrobiota bacterium]